MIVFDGRAILLDVEGTTSSISFVYDVLFTFAKDQVADFLSHERGTEAVQAAAAALAAEVGIPGASLDDPAGRQQVVQAALDLMNRDVKSTPLKALQGMIWRNGFESGQLVSHVFDDVPPALARWADSGLDVRIYSSGSVEAQKLFFAHTAAGDLTRYLCGHYDTTTGPKREASSYARIAADMALEPRQILFLSDVGAELDAARQAGMATALAVRPGNRDPGGLLDHEPFQSFADIVT
ncbi:MAG: acireductone synthase [Planctomycetota bacterium]|nr:acireductone synthase [Planctomycetota bacterium]